MDPRDLRPVTRDLELTDCKAICHTPALGQSSGVQIIVAERFG